MSMPKKPPVSNINRNNIFANNQNNNTTAGITNKTVDNQSNDNLTKDVDFRKITTSPIVIVYYLFIF